MQDPFLRTLAAQRDAAADWIGIFAGEQLELQMRSAHQNGALSDTGLQWLQHCLPGLEACIEARCPVELGAGRDGLTSQYGFPRTAGYPVAVSAMQLSPELQTPKLAAVSGTLRHLPARSPSCPVGADEWWQIIVATQAGNWTRVSQTLAAVVGGQRGDGVAARFRGHRDADTQLVVTVLAAGNAEMSSGLVTVVALPGVEVSAEALRINLG